MRIAIVSDAWRPQVNGVVTTLGKTAEAAGRLGHAVDVVSADGSPSIACPSYPEIRLALRPAGVVRERLEQFAPEMIHIATEGPLGLAARAYCLQAQSSFHDFLSHAVSRLREAALGHSGLARLFLSAMVSSSRRSYPDRNRDACGRTCIHAGSVIWCRGHAASTPQCFVRARGPGSGNGALAAADHAVFRPRCGREEYRRVSRAAHAGYQGHRGRRSGAS